MIGRAYEVSKISQKLEPIFPFSRLNIEKINRGHVKQKKLHTKRAYALKPPWHLLHIKNRKQTNLILSCLPKSSFKTLSGFCKMNSKGFGLRKGKLEIVPFLTDNTFQMVPFCKCQQLVAWGFILIFYDLAWPKFS